MTRGPEYIKGKVSAAAAENPRSERPQRSAPEYELSDLNFFYRDLRLIFNWINNVIQPAYAAYCLDKNNADKKIDFFKALKTSGDLAVNLPRNEIISQAELWAAAEGIELPDLKSILYPNVHLPPHDDYDINLVNYQTSLSSLISCVDTELRKSAQPEQ